RVAGREIAHAGIALPDDAPTILDGRHHAVGVHLEVPGLVVAAERAAHVLTIVFHAAFIGGPQHLQRIDRIGPTPDLHRVPPNRHPERSRGASFSSATKRGPSTKRSLHFA